MEPKKSLGQHWLKDPNSLEAIVAAAEISPRDAVLEIGPGLGYLTEHLLRAAGRVIAVELDEALVKNLQSQYKNQPNLEVVQADILKFDLTELPPNYKIVANIPYYLTSNLVRVISETPNRPQVAVMLVQREVAQRICAEPGQMSLLSVSAQLYFETELGVVVPADLFEPPPKVDSQAVVLRRRPEPLFSGLDEKLFFRVVKAGFSGRRKKLRGSLAAGLALSKPQAEDALRQAGINPDLRAQNLDLQQWHNLFTAVLKLKYL